MSAAMSARFAAEQKPATLAPAPANALATTRPVSDSMSVRTATLLASRTGVTSMFSDEIHQIPGQGAEMALTLVHEHEIVVQVEIADVQLHQLAPLQLARHRHAEDRGDSNAERDELLG